MQEMQLLPPDFTALPDLVRRHAKRRPAHPAIIFDDHIIDWGGFDSGADRVAGAFAREGLGRGDVVAICARMSPKYLLLWIGALRAGLAVAPIADSMPQEVRAGMVTDSGAARLFDDAALESIDDWMAPEGRQPPPVAIRPEDAFNIIYSSGTTGTPKGIVQPHAMRWAHVQRGLAQGYGPDAVTLVSTPLYSNTTLVSLLPTIGLGGTLVLLPKFDTTAFLELSQGHHVTHVMLVPVQYRRLMAAPEFDRYDLARYRGKFCTSAPFSEALKSEVLARWPGGLTEYYGMTEGGGTCILSCHQRPDKLATVGQAAPGSDLRVIDEDGRELPGGAAGEVVGRSPAMMAGYHNRPDATAAAEWHDPSGLRFIRTGDIGRFDEERFLTLVDRKKDVIISGGFNIYPSDLEAVLLQHPAVIEAAVVGAPSEQWGESPVGFVVLRDPADPEHVRSWANQRLGRVQRLSGIHRLDALPRNAIGKVLKKCLGENADAVPTG
jgi:acyl-CoA synthetase (AMP-forming)/AMP-acid ligase II